MHGKDDYDKLYLALERLADAAGSILRLYDELPQERRDAVWQIGELSAAADVARRVLAGTGEG